MLSASIQVTSPTGWHQGARGLPLAHFEIRVAQVVSPAAFWTFEGWDGVRLRHFDIFGPDSNPLKTF